jgi:DNA primase
VSNYYTLRVYSTARRSILSTNDWAELKRQIHVLDLVALLQREGYAPQRRGSVWTLCCPFHSEDTPSFTIYRDNHWHCYGCGLHGDAVDFIRQQHGLSFIAACRYLGLAQHYT